MSSSAFLKGPMSRAVSQEGPMSRAVAEGGPMSHLVVPHLSEMKVWSGFIIYTSWIRDWWWYQIVGVTLTNRKHALNVVLDQDCGNAGKKCSQPPSCTKVSAVWWCRSEKTAVFRILSISAGFEPPRAWPFGSCQKITTYLVSTIASAEGH